MRDSRGLDDGVINSPQTLYDDRADPETRAVLEDWELSHWGSSIVATLGRVLACSGVEPDVCSDLDAADADADVDRNDDNDDDVDVADAGAEVADSGDSGDYYGIDYYGIDVGVDIFLTNAADTGDSPVLLTTADVIDYARALSTCLLEDFDMEPGLYLMQIPITNRAITIVGWLRRIHGDEYELAPGARIVTRLHGSPSWDGIAKLAENGPGDSYKLYDPMKTSEPLHRLIMRRPKPCIESAWIAHVPRPGDWARP